MTTTFQDVDLVVTEIAGLFTTNGSWQTVFDYFPGVDAIKGYTPVLIVDDNGVATDFANLFTNPVEYRLTVQSWVIAYIEGEWTVNQATAKRRELNKVIRQIIRDNAGGTTYTDSLRFEDGFSERSSVIFEGLPYLIERFGVIARLNSGSKP
jgi:hypothetical protein